MKHVHIYICMWSTSVHAGASKINKIGGGSESSTGLSMFVFSLATLNLNECFRKFGAPFREFPTLSVLIARGR